MRGVFGRWCGAAWLVASVLLVSLAGCDNSPWESGAASKNTLFTAMQESSPRHMDPTASYWSTVMRGISGFFEPNPMAFWGSHFHLGAEKAGYYSTMPLRKTLTELADFSLIKRCKPRHCGSMTQSRAIRQSPR